MNNPQNILTKEQQLLTNTIEALNEVSACRKDDEHGVPRRSGWIYRGEKVNKSTSLLSSHINQLSV